MQTTSDPLEVAVRAVLSDARLAAGQWPRMAMIMGAADAIGAVVFAAGLAWAVSAFAGVGSAAAALPGAGLAILGAGGRALAGFVRAHAAFEAGAAARAWAQDRAVEAVIAGGPSRIETQPSGELTSAIITETQALAGYVGRYGPQLQIAIIAPAIIAIAALTQSWVVGTIFLVTAPLSPLFMALFGMGAAAAARDQFEALARLSGRFNDRLRTLGTLKAFGAVEREAAGLASAADQFRAGTMRVLRMAFGSSAALEFFAALSIALTAVYVGFSLLNLFPFDAGETVTLREGLFVLILAPEFYAPLRQLSAAYHDRQSARGAAERLVDLYAPLEDEGAVLPAASRTIAPKTAPAVRFTDVTMTYADGRTGLKGLSFQAPAGKVTALMGPSGSGKTTALKLMMGFERLASGVIFLGHSQCEHGFRDQCAWLGQRARLFHGTMGDNIRFGAPNIDDAAMRAAATAAGVTVFADGLPAGLNTVIGDRGFGLSGGQAQRVALARALASNAPVLLMDEPTAALDRDTEAAFLHALKDAAAGRTIVVATHSAAVADIADYVVSLKEGRAT